MDLNGRHTFASTDDVLDYPDFLDVQLQSFHDFAQADVPPEEREDKGLQAVFKEHFPITDTRDRYTLEFIHYALDPPKHSMEECIAQGLTFSIPIKAKLRLSSKEDEEDEEAEEAIEQEVYLGTLPFMTEQGTFVVNGAERVVVSQLHRSPGAFFGSNIHPNGTRLYSARIIPFRGSWVEFSTDVRDTMWAYIDRKKKLPVTTLLRALGHSSTEEIVALFDVADQADVSTKKKFSKFIGQQLAVSVTAQQITEVVDEDTGEVIEEHKEREVLLPAEHELEEDDYDVLKEAGIGTVFLMREDKEEQEDELDMTILVQTLQADPAMNEEEALYHLYEVLRGSEAPDLETARGVLSRLFFSEKRYDLGDVGRYRLNKRLGIDVPGDTQVLTDTDIIAIVRELMMIINGRSTIDDIDHLSNRRVRTVGEQLGSQFSLGLARMSRTIKERMNLRDADSFTPQDLVNARTVSSVINTFFGTNQLSQFMDQTNPLSELTHKRRMSALGPGGLTRERAGFEVRDVHYTHYGRLCPIETPEGPNIGLISSLCVHATINDFGFIETPYRVVEDGVVTDRIEYLTAEEEDRAVIAQANAPLGDDGSFLRDDVKCRHEGDFPIVPPKDVQYMDVAANQTVSPSASLVVFLDHDDANRALMGSNMQRQAVPLLRSDSPIVGTGLEGRVARDSRAVVVAKHDGVIEYVDANRIVVRYERDEDDEDVSFGEPIEEYKLTKFRRTNQDTTVNQKPIVKQGEEVTAGQVLTDGFCTDKGDLALGKNVLVAFMPWRGYNFEDAIVVSERLVRDDVYTSVHIEEFECEVRDTKRGEEELTREIPNVSEEATRDLDERGIIRMGAEVEPGDIIVGKITPKGETDPTPEEKLLRAIFGDKAGDVKDASLKAPPGMKGVVIGTNLFSRRKLDPATKKREQERLNDIEEYHERELTQLNASFWEKLENLVEGKPSVGIEDREGRVLVSEGAEISIEDLQGHKPINLVTRRDYTEDATINDKVRKLYQNYRKLHNELEGEVKREKHRVQMGDELPAGIVQLAKVYVAKKRKIQVGDKMAGRHGNKGVISAIMPIEDMPFDDNGEPVDVVLNPLGVPSRMNVGQILETHLGLAAWGLGRKIDHLLRDARDQQVAQIREFLGEVYNSTPGTRVEEIEALSDDEVIALAKNLKAGVPMSTPVFDGADEREIKHLLRLADLPDSGQMTLYDGRTGDAFDRSVTVGYMYMLKLNHLVDDKMHARSTGSYSLVTQQPLGGKAQFGGQRFGEMEVWALEAYGAAYTLQEMLTVKSDDVEGRTKMYKNIVDGDHTMQAGMPESFNVLVKEIRSLGIDIELES